MEQIVSVSDYLDIIALPIIEVCVLIGIIIAAFRFILLFRYYVQTGELGDLGKGSWTDRITDGTYDGLLRPMFFGIHPGAIIFDATGWLIIGFIIALLWIPILFIAPPILLARWLRKRVAAKQEFIAKLNGTQT